jgi:hypothetical protein
MRPSWLTRLKAVEREYVVARFATDRLDQQTRENRLYCEATCGFATSAR